MRSWIDSEHWALEVSMAGTLSPSEPTIDPCLPDRPAPIPPPPALWWVDGAGTQAALEPPASKRLAELLRIR